MKGIYSQLFLLLVFVSWCVSLSLRHGHVSRPGIAWEASISGAGLVKIHQEQWAGDSLWIDWGDGQVEALSIQTGLLDYQHAYRGRGPYQMVVRADKAAIYQLRIQGSNVTQLDLGQLWGLEELDAFDCSLSGNLDLRGCTALLGLDLGYNDLTSLDVRGLQNLKRIDAPSNHLSELQGLSDCQDLHYLGVTQNAFESLDVTNLSQLEWLIANQNDLSQAMDLRSNPQLKVCHLDENRITSLRLSGLSQLREISLSENQVSNLSQVVEDLDQSYSNWRQQTASQSITNRMRRPHHFSIANNPGRLNASARSRIQNLRNQQWLISE